MSILCRYCGNEITSKYGKTYCSRECVNKSFKDENLDKERRGHLKEVNIGKKYPGRASSSTRSASVSEANFRASEKRILEAIDNDLVKSYQEGTSIIALTEKYNLGTELVKRALRLNGIIVRNISEQSKFQAPRSKRDCFTDKDGYNHILLPDSNRYVPEHRYVWEQYHQKLIPMGWAVHHLNGIKNDNRPENLVAVSRKEHAHQIEPFKKRIRELELRIELLERALDSQQFSWSEN